MSHPEDQKRRPLTALFEKGADDVLVLVDLSAFVFRAYHALAPLTSPSGEPTHAVYGAVTMLERLINQSQPKMLGFALDSGRQTFRQQLYPEYKANRPEPPEDLIAQLVRMTEIVSATSHLVWQCPGFEADDIIATVVRQAREQGLRVLIVGADKDLTQLIGPDVILWDPPRDKVLGDSEVLEKFGVSVPQVRDWLALTGDSSDNIPGVPSVGPKTASELLTQFKDLEGIYSHIAEVARKKLRETLVEHRELALLSQRLVTLNDHCGVALDPSNLRWKGRDIERLRAIYEQLGFTRLLATLGEKSKSVATSVTAISEQRTAASAEPPTCIWIESDEQLAELLNRAAQHPRLAMALHRQDDSQTSSPWAYLSLALELGQTYIVPFVQSLLGGPKALPQQQVAQRLREFSGQSVCQIATHGAKRLWLALLAEGIQQFPLEFDVELADYLLDAQAAHDLTEVSARVAGRDNAFDKITAQHLGSEQLELRMRSLAAEAQAILQVSPLLQDQLNGEGLTRLLADVEMPLSRVLARMQRLGVAVDCAHLSALSQQMRAELARLEVAAHQAAGRAFNLQSPRQLEALLFDELGLKPIRRTKTTRSTDARTLEALIDEHPVIPLVLEHRHIAKLEGTYVHTLPTLVSAASGRVHTSWEQASTATGRISSIDPNLQNIPIRSELGRSIRRAFVAPEGYVLMSADYSQVELRVLAHLSQDRLLLEAFRSGTDVHQRTAMAIFGVSPDAVTPDMRRRAKAVNFGVIYGQSEGGLARALGIARSEASTFIATYFQQHAGVRSYMSEILTHARQGQAVRSLLGRRRLLPQISNSNRSLRLAAERMAMNMPIQGTAADLLKLAMLRLEEPPSPGSRMVLTVHDELVFEVPTDEQTQAREAINDAMQHAAQLSVPLLVDIGSGSNWMQAHDGSVTPPTDISA